MRVPMRSSCVLRQPAHDTLEQPAPDLVEELERRVDSGEMAVAFSMYATRMEDLMAVADAGEVMPPKSTWFEPKLLSGLATHLLD